MKKANEINAENIYEIQRPFISVTQIYASPAVSGGLITGARFNPVVQNSGNTPARNLVFYINFDSVVDPIRNDYGFPNIDSVIRYPAVGAPKSVIPMPNKLITVDELINIQGERKHFYIYGSAEYRDRFADTSSHITLFCFQLSSIVGDLSSALSNTARAMGDSILFNWPTCQRHNCTDEECREEGFVK